MINARTISLLHFTSFRATRAELCGSSFLLKTNRGKSLDQYNDGLFYTGREASTIKQFCFGWWKKRYVTLREDQIPDVRHLLDMLEARLDGSHLQLGAQEFQPFQESNIKEMTRERVHGMGFTLLGDKIHPVAPNAPILIFLVRRHA